MVVLPLYPQYSGTTTGAVQDALSNAQSHLTSSLSVRVIEDYHDHPAYINALTESVNTYWQQHGQGDYLLCSYHGIPQRYADNGDDYPQQCEVTTQLLRTELQLDNEQMGMSYQSRFGQQEWVKPYTDTVIRTLPERGIHTLDILAPGFSCDCLETLEEIMFQYREVFEQSGGRCYRYIPCLNDSDPHIEMMRVIIESVL